jgi:choline dehydrogenase-like flavoprotein
MTSRGYATPISYGLGGLSPDAPRWGAGYKQALREEAGRRITVTSFTTVLPLETNRVDLDPEVKDDWGLPAMRITSQSHPDDMKNAEFFRQKSIEVLEAAGATNIWAPPAGDSRGSAHIRRGPLSPGARRAQSLRRGRKQPRHRRAEPSDHDDPGARVPRGRAPGSLGSGR